MEGWKKMLEGPEIMNLTALGGVLGFGAFCFVFPIVVFESSPSLQFKSLVM